MQTHSHQSSRREGHHSYPVRVVAQNRFTTLDALRGAAAVVVVWFHLGHAGWAAGPERGYLAVDLFFALSGFVLAFRYDERFRTGLTAFNFFRARFIRLYPLFIAGLGLGLGFELKKLVGAGVSIGPLVGTGIFNVFMLPAPGLGSAHGLFPADTPAWSLFFELFIANLSFAVLWRHLQGTVLVAVITIGAVGVVVAVADHGSADGGWRWSTAPLGFVRVIFSFYVGVWLARRHAASPARRALPSWLFVLGVFVVLSMPLPHRAAAAADIVSIFVIFPAMIWWGATAVERNPLIGRTAGDVSYALYTIHVPLFLICDRGLRHFGIEPRMPQAIAFVAGAVLLAFALDKLYDPPARRALGRLLHG